jgi:hypothetical protein
MSLVLEHRPGRTICSRVQIAANRSMVVLVTPQPVAGTLGQLGDLPIRSCRGSWPHRLMRGGRGGKRCQAIGARLLEPEPRRLVQVQGTAKAYRRAAVCSRPQQQELGGEVTGNGAAVGVPV